MSTTSTEIARQHLSSRSGVCGSKPCIAGTRIRVQDVYVWHELQGQSVDEIVAKFPQITHGDVYSGLAYFWDHRTQMLEEMQAADAFVEEAMKRFPSKLGDKSSQKKADDDSVSPR